MCQVWKTWGLNLTEKKLWSHDFIFKVRLALTSNFFVAISCVACYISYHTSHTCDVWLVSVSIWGRSWWWSVVGEGSCTVYRVFRYLSPPPGQPKLPGRSIQHLHQWKGNLFKVIKPNSHPHKSFRFLPRLIFPNNGVSGLWEEWGGSPESWRSHSRSQKSKNQELILSRSWVATHVR